MLKITFEPYEELTVEDLDRIMEFISQFGKEVVASEEE